MHPLSMDAIVVKAQQICPRIRELAKSPRASDSGASRPRSEMRLLMSLGRRMLVTVGKLKDAKSGGFPLESRRVWKRK